MIKAKTTTRTLMNETETETVTTTHTHEADNIGEIVTQETIDNEGILDYIIAV